MLRNVDGQGASDFVAARVDKNGLGNSHNVVVLCATKDDRLLIFEQGP
jgi:hypothetical protein